MVPARDCRYPAHRRGNSVCKLEHLQKHLKDGKVFSDSSKAFRETSFIATAWLRDTHHSVQVQEARLEQVKQDTQDQGRKIHANIADIGCIQTNYKLHGERLERLERIVSSQERALLSQEGRLREVEEGSKKVEGDLQVLVQRVEDWDPTSRQGIFLIAESGGLGTSARETARSSPGDWQSPPQPQGSESRRGLS